MPSREEIMGLRQSAGDQAAFAYLSSQDAGFKGAVDRVRSQNPTMGALEEHSFPSAMIDLYYGSQEKKPENPLTTQMFAATMQEPQQDGSSFVGRTIRNIPKSAAAFAGDIFKAVTNPFETAGAAADAVIGGGANAIETIAALAGVQNSEEIFDLDAEKTASAIGQFFAERYGSPEAIKQTIESDPVGFAADLAGVLSVTGATARGMGFVARSAGAAGRSNVLATAGTALQKTARAIDPIENASRMAKSVAGLGKKAGQFATSQATGISPKALSSIIDDTDTFAKAEKGGITRISLAEKMGKAIDDISDDLSETGKAYEAIRNSGQVTNLPSVFTDYMLSEGLVIDDAGRISVPVSARLRLSKPELGALQSFYDDVRKLEGTNITANEFLNIRRDLSKIAKFDKTAPADELERAAKAMRKNLNESSRGGIVGLDNIDAAYEPLVDNLRSMRREFIDPRTGELKTSSVSKVANLNGNGKELLRKEITRVIGKDFADDLFKEVNALSALEDVELASGQKVGTYARSAIGGGAVVTGNVPLLAGAILASPTIAVKLLKVYGKAKGISKSTIGTMSKKILSGEKLSGRYLKIMNDVVKEADIAMKELVPLSERINASVSE